jgi:CheY-like chemotaxis protein
MDQPTIVVVDDDPVFLDLVQRILKPQGYRAVTALDGQKGLALCRHEQPALVITGLVMPVMGGCELCRQLRHDTNLGGMPRAAGQPARRM